MAKACKAKQINLATLNKVGMLAKVSSAVAGAKVNLNALCAWGDKKKAYFYMVAERHMKAKNALTKAKFKVTDEDVILVEMPNKPGEMQKVAQKIADAGINILYAYGSAGSGRTSFCIFKTENDKKAIRVIQGK
ncbi:MAG TPA: hypothetical protein EYP21_02925 [Syntrophaceae bacterium]|nr:hypothetical protein [Syntrophaceae bacterium]